MKDQIINKRQVHLMVEAALNDKYQVRVCKRIAEVIKQQVWGSKKEETVRIIMVWCTLCPSKVGQPHLWIGRQTQDWQPVNRANLVMEALNMSVDQVNNTNVQKTLSLRSHRCPHLLPTTST